MKNADYWRRRFGLLKEAAYKDASQTKADIEREFTLAQRETSKQINDWYARFADNNQITLADARRMLNKKELAEFKWDVDEYIRRGKENAVDGRWMKELENASARAHISRLEELKLETRNTMEALYAKTGGGVAGHLKDLYNASYLHNAFEVQKGLGAGSRLTGLDPAHIEKVLSKPWTTDGATFSDRIWNQKEKLIDSVHTQLTQNMILGRPPAESIDAIAKEFNTSRSNASRLVMTESAFFAAAADQESFKALGVEHFEILATLDEKTCARCGALDGEHFPMPQYDIGVTVPPFHPNCYCTAVPWFEGDADPGKRAARDEDGKSYEVPADMQFQEWKEKFIDGGDKSGLQKDDRDGIDEWSRVDVTNDELKNDPTEVIINMGDIEKSFGTYHTNAIKDILNNAPDDMKTVWNKYADGIKIGTIKSSRSFFEHFSGVNIDLDAISKEALFIGELAEKPYYTAFHEFGHNIDDIYQWANGDYRNIGDVFKSNKHLLSDGSGYTLTEMLKSEGSEYINNVWAGLKKEAIAAGGKASDVLKYNAYESIENELSKKSVLSTFDVSDMWDGITGGKILPHYGHGKSYWKTHSVGTEAFAEMFSASVMNPDSVSQIKNYFPKSFEIFGEIINQIGS